MPARPNVVWICADDFTPDACGAYGSAVARTWTAWPPAG
jgi:arylsulfatase A-like enzyme